MAETPYLIGLNLRLGERLAAWPAARREAVAAAVRAWRVEGGFAGRLGGADLYYTAFGLRVLAVLGQLDEATRSAARAYLETCPAGRAENLIDIVSLAFARRMVDESDPQAWPDQAVLLEVVAAHRTADGAFGRVPGARASGTYSTFLAVQAYDLLGAPLPEPGRLLAPLQARQRADGGYAESDASAVGSVNPTAAALAVALACGQADPASLLRAVQFLMAGQCEDGGWPAAPHAPASDLLSTFTALLTLHDAGALDGVDLAAAGAFVAACTLPNGTYAAMPGDPDSDVEYIFYGLGCAAMLGQ
jgi:geranylgeranyl transferase type-2 subunit beta